MSLADRLVAVLSGTRFERVDITGCEAQGDADLAYMTRWRLTPRSAPFAVYLHVFHRSDLDRLMHDHPWSFVTIPLVWGYREHTPQRVARVLPLVPLYRPATWRHCVELYRDRNGANRKAVTLVIRGPVRREWGFVLPSGRWVHWRDFFSVNGCKSAEEAASDKGGADDAEAEASSQRAEAYWRSAAEGEDDADLRAFYNQTADDIARNRTFWQTAKESSRG